MKKLWLLLGLISCSDANGTASNPDGTPPSAGLRLDTVVTGLASPVFLTAPTGDTRLFVVEQDGRIRIVKDGKLLAAPFLDIRDRVGSGGERGLLSVAFHPQYSENGLFYVNYTNKAGNTHIERYTVSGSADVADPKSAKLLLAIDQPYANHNGGQNAFGPDGMLYVGMGDGGSGGDPRGNGQNNDALLGKILRLDVDRGDPYGIPSTNPFAAGGGAKEIWATGMRNPWRFSFDVTAGLLLVADVGQGMWEEIDAVPVAQAGVNYGWNTMEGSHCFRSVVCSKAGLTEPIHEYSHADGCSITGGYVYRGSRMTQMVGNYFYSDYCQGWIRSLKITNGKATSHQTWNVAKVGSITSFGQDGAGELYVLSSSGTVYRMSAGS